ncbi:MAG: cupin domain-containing protein [Chloroflexota bacterium]
MPVPEQNNLSYERERRRRRRQRSVLQAAAVGNVVGGAIPTIDVGGCLRKLRTERQLSIRALAELSSLNVNTLSMIENGKTSPSVSTLQQIAGALAVPITAFFETEISPKNVVFQKAGQRPQAAFEHGILEDLGAGMALRWGQPLRIVLEPGADSGPTPIVHTGHEFVYCLEGSLDYTIEARVYHLQAGDNLLFEAYLPHSWRNPGNVPSASLLVLCPSDENDRPTERHFAADVGRQEEV